MSVDLDSRPDVVAALRALADPMRWQMVELLADEELCVCHLVELLEVGQPLVSHHLKVLRDAGIVTSERYRYWTYYRLVPQVLDALATRFAAAAAGAPPPGERRRPCC